MNQDDTHDLRAFALCPPATLSPVTLSQLHCVLKSRTEKVDNGITQRAHVHVRTITLVKVQLNIIMNIIKVKKKKTYDSTSLHSTMRNRNGTQKEWLV